jgi:hypothetical protein
MLGVSSGTEVLYIGGGCRHPSGLQLALTAGREWSRSAAQRPRLLTALPHCRTPSRFPDHIYGDILRSKKSLGWRTMLVVPELEMELECEAQSINTQNEMRALRAQRCVSTGLIAPCSPHPLMNLPLPLLTPPRRNPADHNSTLTTPNPNNSPHVCHAATTCQTRSSASSGPSPTGQTRPPASTRSGRRIAPRSWSCCARGAPR